jgi:hypothetical protein
MESWMAGSRPAMVKGKKKAGIAAGLFVVLREAA